MSEITATPEWLAVHHGDAPLIVSFPHSGTEIPPDIESRLISQWRARKDADHWIDVLYDFAHDMGATTIRTALSRTVVDVNRDPSGASLYPGQATTGLCPLETFDAEPLYHPGKEPDEAEIERRKAQYFWPFHARLAAEAQRLRERHGRVVIYDAHSIRSHVPRLFKGELPQFNIGTHQGASCDVALTAAVAKICAASSFSHVVNARFRGGWITRHYGKPEEETHTLQMELAMRGYLHEPKESFNEHNWPTPLDDAHAATLRVALRDILDACLKFAMGRSS
jgi:N-formylglutamate deformylase